MSRRLVLRRRAVVELKEARDWYEARGSGLGDTFIDEFEGVLRVIEEHPLRFPLVYRDVRRALTRRFPYAIWFASGTRWWSSSPCSIRPAIRRAGRDERTGHRVHGGCTVGAAEVPGPDDEGLSY